VWEFGGPDPVVSWTKSFPSSFESLRDLAYSRLGTQIAVLHDDAQLTIVDAENGDEIRSAPVDPGSMTVSWSSNSGQMFVGTYSGEGRVFDFVKGRYPKMRVDDSRHLIRWGEWLPDGSRLATASSDRTIRIWSSTAPPLTLEGHTGEVLGLCFSHDGRLMYSVAADATVRCWRTDSWECVAIIPIPGGHHSVGGLWASPTEGLLARRTAGDLGLEIYSIDIDRLLVMPAIVSRTYANAKVVLLGDTGVGKSGLGLVLSDQSYRPTDSTHARQVWTFDDHEVELADGRTEKREVLIWDLAGQPGYRLIHQLHLAEAAVALVVFDARSETDPFSGVRYWMRALNQYRAGRPGSPAPPAILVAARVDRGGIPASRDRVLALCAELGFVDYFETSAKEGRRIAELAEAVRAAIDWTALPRSVSNDLFETIKEFLVDEKDRERVLATVDDLFRAFRHRYPHLRADDVLRAGFETCIRLLEGRDLLRRLSFGGFVLLRPELLDSYASALIDAARGQPDGLGYMAEKAALEAAFPIPEEDRLPGEEERLLLIATVEELIRHDLALRETTETSVDLVFPSQFTVDRPEAPALAADVVFHFEGTVAVVYATLAVRLSRMASYQRGDMWRNASTYLAKVGGTCGLRVREDEEGSGELTVFFDEAASEETRFLFEEYVHAHVNRHAAPDTVGRERVFRCQNCGYRLPADLVRRRKDRGQQDVNCPDCEAVRVSVLDREDRLGAASQRSVHQMNASADAGRDAAAASVTIHGKEASGDYDVFLSYNSVDRGAVSGIAERLRADGLLPWIDTDDIPPGQRWQPQLATQIMGVRAVAIFLGPSGLGRWQRPEIDEFLDEQTRRPGLRIIPVLLHGGPEAGQLPPFLRQWNAVDFRIEAPDPFERLRWAITGERPPAVN
jgi:small GTP-binding protein